MTANTSQSPNNVIKPLKIDISNNADKQKVIQAVQSIMTTHAQEIRALADK